METINCGITPVATNEVGFNLRDQADHFSSLPDNIITQIFSYLTMTDALSICISCKKLMHLWNTIPHLEFKESADDSFNLLVDAKKRNLVQVIDRFLKHHDYPIQTFRLLFYPGWFLGEVLSWIGLVTKRGLIELDLNFLSNLGVPIQLPSRLLNSETLQVLKLRSCILESSLGFFGLGSLKSLILEDVTLSDDMIDALLSQSRLLRSVSLENCKGFQSIKVKDVNAVLSLSLENCYSLSSVFAPRAQTLCICSGKIKVFIIEASLVRNLMVLYTSATQPFQREALLRTPRMLGEVKLSEDEEVENLTKLEYIGMAKLELEIQHCEFKELHGHAWLLRNACVCVDKVVVSIAAP